MQIPLNYSSQKANNLVPVKYEIVFSQLRLNESIYEIEKCETIELKPGEAITLNVLISENNYTTMGTFMEDTTRIIGQGLYCTMLFGTGVGFVALAITYNNPSALNKLAK